MRFLLGPLSSLALALCLASPLGAVEGLPPARMAFRSYGGGQGLGNLAVNSVVQDRQGFLWVATEDGLFRYDGQRFQGFSLTQGLPSSLLNVLHLGADGTLWAGTYSGLARWTGSRFDGTCPGLPAASVQDLATGPGGQLWVATPEGPFVREGAVFRLAPGWPGGEATSVWGRKDLDEVWVGSVSRVWRWRRNEGWKAFGEAESAGGIVGRVDALQRDGSGTLWARSIRGLWALAPGAQRFTDESVRVASISPRGLLSVDRRGTLWVPTGHNLARLERGQWTYWGPDQGLGIAWSGAPLEDVEGSLWLPSQGLQRLLGGGAWQSYTVKEGLPDDTIWTIWRDRDRRLWVGTDKGLAEATPQGWRKVPGTEGHSLRSVTQDSEGALYMAGTPAEVLRYEPRTGRLAPLPVNFNMLGKQRIFRILMDPQDRLWVASEGGGLLMGRKEGGSWRFDRVEVPGGDAKERFSDVRLDRQGRLWAAGERGLACLEPGSGGKEGTWRRFGAKDGLKRDHVSYVVQLHDGDFIVPYFEPMGMARIRYEGGAIKVLEHWDTSRGLASDKFYQVGEDARGRIWAGSGRGVDRIDPAAPAGRQVVHFGAAEGLISEDCDAMAFMAEPDGDVWVGTSAGLSHFLASRDAGTLMPPPSALVSARLGSREWSPESAKALDVPFRDNTLEVHFAGLSYLNEDRIQHEVRLQGLEKEWHTTGVREARYTALPAGSYTFEVRARLEGGDWGPPASLAFTVRPAWWQSWWFRTLLGLGGLGLVGLVIRWRLSALKRHNAELAQMVHERTEELEAAMEALRNQSLTDPLTGLKNRRYLNMTIEEDLAVVARTHRNLSESRADRVPLNSDLVFVMVDVDHFKQVNDTYGHAAGDHVLMQVSEILRQASRTTDTVIRWGGEEFLVVARNSCRDDAAILAERIRSMVEAHPFDLGHGQTLHRTCSVGFAPFPFQPGMKDGLGWEQVVDLADRSLYAAKRGGRNAWVGLLAGSGFTAEVGAAHDWHVSELIAKGYLIVKTSHPDPEWLPWDK